MSPKPQRRRNNSIPPLKFFTTSLDCIDVEFLVMTAEDNARIFYDAEIKTNQIRNFYGAAEKIKKKYFKNGKNKQAAFDVTPDLWLLLPQLAYTEGRNNSAWRFCKSMKNAVEKVLASAESSRHHALDNFFIYVESVVAYHKFYGDK